MTRRMLVILFLTLLALFLTSCASYDSTRLRLEQMPQRYQQFDLALGWQARVLDGQTLIEGAVKNVSYSYMFDLEIWVAAFDPAGKLLARSVAFVIPSQLALDEETEFAVKLPLVVAPGSKLRFTYKYRSDNGRDRDGFGIGMMRGTDWMQTFDAVMPAR